MGRSASVGGRVRQHKWVAWVGFVVVGVGVAADQPQTHAAIRLKPTSSIGVLACRSDGFLVIFYFVWSGLRKKIGNLSFVFFCLLWTGGGGGGGGGCGCG